MSPRHRLCPAGATVAVLAEGGDEERMVQRFLGDAPFYLVARGRGDLRNVAAAGSKDPGWDQIRSVAVVLDAEEDVSASFELACGALAAMGWPLPPAPGQVVVEGDRRTGVFILPDNLSPGASEALLLQTATDAERACVDAFFACMGQTPGGNVARRDKARAHALAAARGEGRPEQLWPKVDVEHPALATLRGFLRALESR